MADTLGLMGDYYDHFFIERDSQKHSGNWEDLERVFTRGLFLKQAFRVGYYGDRLDNSARLCPVNPIMQWSEE